MGRASSSQPPSRSSSRWIRAAIGAAVVLVVVLVPVVLFAADDGSSSHHEPPVVKGDALATVRAALGQTASSGNYELDSESTSSGASGTQSYQFTSHTIVNLEPYAMVSSTRSSAFGMTELHVNSTQAWQLGAATAGYGPGNPGVPLDVYAHQVIGSLGPGPGALAMISIASHGGNLNLEEQAIATAQPSGTGTVRDVPVTYYDVTVDITKLADVPNLSDVERQTITDALPLLEGSGYRGTSERIGVGEQGYVREVTSTTKFDNGSSMAHHSVLSNFGCAPKVYMPNETPPPVTTTQPCAPSAPTTTSPSTSAPTTGPRSTTTSVPSTSTSATTTTSSPSTTTSSSTTSTSTPEPTTP